MSAGGRDARKDARAGAHGANEVAARSAHGVTGRLGLLALFVLASLLTRWLSLVVEVLDVDERWDRYPLGDYPRLERLVGERYERIDGVAPSRRLPAARLHRAPLKGRRERTDAHGVSGTWREMSARTWASSFCSIWK